MAVLSTVKNLKIFFVITLSKDDSTQSSWGFLFYVAGLRWIVEWYTLDSEINEMVLDETQIWDIHVSLSWSSLNMLQVINNCLRDCSLYLERFWTRINLPLVEQSSYIPILLRIPNFQHSFYSSLEPQFFALVSSFSCSLSNQFYVPVNV